MAVQRDSCLLYGAEIRQRILDDVADDISRLGKRRKVGRLVSVGIGDVEEIAVYIRGQARAAAAVADVASWTTPVPGGVGPVKVAMLMRNAAIALEKQIELGWV